MTTLKPSSPAADSQAQLRSQLHGMWEAVAPHWAEHADYTDARHAQNAQRLLGLTRPQPGERVLELASGAGGVGLAAARLVAPHGEVVISDVSAQMTAAAAARAQRLGLTVTTRVLDQEDIAEPDASFDVVLSRDGLQFAGDPARAVAESRRVLRSGGRLAVAVWGPREANPWLGLVMDAVTAVTGMQVPPPGLPGPFALDDAARLAGIFTGAGLVEVTVTDLDVPLDVPSFDDWWARTSALAGPLAAILASLPSEAIDAIRERARQLTAPYATADGLAFPGLALLAYGRRPDAS
jgi:ubiquinone/menaquinone biosynthesis C-methylase UbiE